MKFNNSTIAKIAIVVFIATMLYDCSRTRHGSYSSTECTTTTWGRAEMEDCE